MIGPSLGEALAALSEDLRRQIAVAPNSFVAPGVQRRAEDLIRSAVLALATSGGHDVRAIGAETQPGSGAVGRAMLPADLLVTVELVLRGISDC